MCNVSAISLFPPVMFPALDSASRYFQAAYIAKSAAILRNDNV